MSNKELLGCPFCGGEAQFHLIDEADHSYCVECTRCWASSRVHLSLKEDARPFVASTWNKRQPDPRVAVLEERLDTAHKQLDWQKLQLAALEAQLRQWEGEL